VRALGVALSAALVTACFSEPARPHESSDAGPDSGSGSGSGGPAPQVRLISHAYYSSSSASSGMSGSGWTIPTTGVHDDDLLLFIANIDNGSVDAWQLPAGFTSSANNFFGSDGQTYVAGYKRAHGEASSYSASYGGTNIVSASAVIMLLAVTGYDPAQPVSSAIDMPGAVGVHPVPLAGDVTTVRANSLLVFAGGADWLSGTGANLTQTPPPGYTTIEAITDRGGSSVTWTSQLVAYKVQPTVGDTGQHTGSITPAPAIDGMPWTIELVIPPPP